jgi:hypothetical protein
LTTPWVCATITAIAPIVGARSERSDEEEEAMKKVKQVRARTVARSAVAVGFDIGTPKPTLREQRDAILRAIDLVRFVVIFSLRDAGRKA